MRYVRQTEPSEMDKWNSYNNRIINNENGNIR